MKKIFDYKDGKFIIEFEFNDEHLRTLYTIKANEGYVAFTNRDPMSDEDLDGNEISWGICDDLVDMGLLCEDEEAHEVGYELSNDGEQAMEIIASKF